jgi:hypothetical protein
MNNESVEQIYRLDQHASLHPKSQGEIETSGFLQADQLSRAADPASSTDAAADQLCSGV